jgi:hypothetical protein
MGGGGALLHSHALRTHKDATTVGISIVFWATSCTQYKSIAELTHVP